VQTRSAFRLFEALAGFLAAIAAGGTLVLLLDDLHWVDRATCDVLVYALTRSDRSIY